MTLHIVEGTVKTEETKEGVGDYFSDKRGIDPSTFCMQSERMYHQSQMQVLFHS